MVVDDSGSVYLTGHSGVEGDEIITLKYDTNGRKLWEAKYEHKVGVVRSMAIDDCGNVYLACSGGHGGGEYVIIKYAPQ